ncbi:MAG: creatininase family protein [Alphaproteobacteria bacterium]|nr:creatininase family protein [Alphaproteobacteria bacterium]
MTDPRHRRWGDLTTQDFASLDPERTVALLPIAATEQHGPHLPLSTDADIAAGLIAAGADRLEEGVDLLILPMLGVGLSPEHADFAGTLTLEPETLLAAICEIGAGVAASGVRKLALFNSHGGQSQMLDLAAQRLRREDEVLAVAINGYRLWRADEIFPEDEVRHGIHAGAVETSIMLHLQPALVRQDRLASHASLSARMAGDYERLTPFGRVGFGWQAQDLSETGACGDATLASAEAGRLLVDQAAAALAALLAEIARLPLDTLKERG